MCVYIPLYSICVQCFAYLQFTKRFAEKYHFYSICKAWTKRKPKHFKWITRIFRFFTDIHKYLCKKCVHVLSVCELVLFEIKRDWKRFQLFELHEQRISLIENVPYQISWTYLYLQLDHYYKITLFIHYKYLRNVPFNNSLIWFSNDFYCR